MPANFDPTRPHFDTVLPRVSDFQRRQRQAGQLFRDGVQSTLQATLEPALLQDLQRFEGGAAKTTRPEVLEVVAAAVRHGRGLRLLLEHDGLVLPLTVLPMQRVVHAPLPSAQWGLLRWSGLKVLQVDAADADAPVEHIAPLGLVLWALALHGSRAELLPEIAGPVAYRIAPSTDFSGLDLAGTLASAVTRLRRQTTPLAEICAWPGLDRERATRLLNGLYLQSGLIITRSHPAASGSH
ncbi:MAG: hypothetical protein Q7U99_06625 [Rubrivivax sp.]|nr:hypothetical protein [Rubrivivax sp.]